LDPVTPAKQIQFLLEDFDDSNVNKIIHHRTVAFDVDGSYALVVFADNEGKIRIRMGANNVALRDRKRFGGKTPLEGNYDIKDIQIYHKNISATESGKVLLLDSLNNQVGI